MTTPGTRTRGAWFALSALIFTACGDGGPTEPEFPLPGLVGDWTATSLLLTSHTDPPQTINAVELGAEFFMNVQPSGGYTSSLRFRGFSTADVGQLEVAGDELIFHVEQSITGPRVDTADFELSGDRLTIGGSTIFDFDGDGINENATLNATLERDEGS